MVSLPSSSSSEDRGSNNSMTSNRLHSFSFPPFLKWGTQRHLRCTTTATAANTTAGASSSAERRESNSDESTLTRNVHATASKLNSISERLRGGEEAIAVVREKLTLDLKAEADRIKEAILKNEQEGEREQEREQERERERERQTVRSWNLRTRRTECKSAAVAVAVAESGDKCCSPVRVSGGGGGGAVKLTRSRRTDLEKRKMETKKTTERVKFSVPLSKSEVEEDFMALFGHRPPRRPNKRPRTVQKELDNMFPGLWLTEITADMYKVLDTTNGNGGKVRQSAKRKV